jgi:two-component system LytT family response regulator
VTHNVVIVEDEPPARAKLRRLLAEHADFSVVAEADSVETGRAALATHRPAVLFLDIQLGAESGFDVLQAAAGEPPLVVFTTAYSEHAVKAFELQALDYLLKPFDRDRFAQSIERTRAALRQSDIADVEERVRRLLASLPERRTPALTQLPVRESERTVLVPTDEIVRLAAADNYVEVITPERKYLVRETLTSLASQLDPERFLRVHRSHVVRIDCIREIRPWFHGDYQLILRDGTELSLSRRFKALLPPAIRDRL